MKCFNVQEALDLSVDSYKPYAIAVTTEAKYKEIKEKLENEIKENAINKSQIENKGETENTISKSNENIIKTENTLKQLDIESINKSNVEEKNTSKAVKSDNKTNGTNVIIYGVPGSGKSYYIKNNVLVNSKKEKLNKQFYERVIFFPEYSYYDFVGQRLPDETGTLKFNKGPFTKILEKALKDENNHYYLIIEEMNRGNAEAIFGDILQLLDRNASSNGESEYGIYNEIVKELDLNISNSETSENKIKIEKIIKKIEDKGGIYIPCNLSIYATLNNADQNVFNIDTAFGRRWEYKLQYCNPSKTQKNKENECYFDWFIAGTNVKWNEFRNAINEVILEKSEEIYNAEEKQMGLYYICPLYLLFF